MEMAVGAFSRPCTSIMRSMSDRVADRLDDGDRLMALNAIHVESRSRMDPTRAPRAELDGGASLRRIMLLASVPPRSNLVAAGEPVALLAAKLFMHGNAERVALDVEHAASKALSARRKTPPMRQ